MYSTQVDSLAVALSAQLAAHQTFQSDVLATVYWALGAVFTIAVLLVGFGWFANFRIYQRDLDSMRVHVDATVREAVATAQTLLEREISEAARGIRGEAMHHVNERLRDARRHQLRFEGHFYESLIASPPFGKLDAAVKLLKNALELQDDFVVSRALVYLADELSRSNVLDAAHLGDLARVIGEVPDSHAIHRDRVLEAIRTVGAR